MRIIRMASLTFDHLVDVASPNGAFQAYPIPRRGIQPGMVAVRKRDTGEVVVVRESDCSSNEEWETRMDEVWTRRERAELDKAEGQDGGAP